MPNVIEVVAPIVRTIVWLAPELVEVPILGRILISFGAGHPDTDAQALEKFQAATEKDKDQREKTRNQNNKHVIKVSKALECVEGTVMNSGIILDFLKVVWRIIRGDSTDIGRVMYSRIERCILENYLRQDTPRVKRSGSFYHRPAKGHGKGRRRFGA